MDIDALLARLPFESVQPPPRVNVVRLTGIIGRFGGLQRGLTLAGLAGVLERAFRPKHLAAVALAINSPGGSPVQSSLIAGRIRQLADEKQVPVLAFVEDVAASGGYWLAVAADEIFVDPASIVGSIGVITAGFGFHELIQRIGVERRLHTQGVRKSMLDPFRPEQPEDVARLEDLQHELHEVFKEQVRRRRGAKLEGSDGDLFEGDIWTGRRAVDLGLADGIGDLRSVLRQRFGEKVKLRVIDGQAGWLRRRFGLVRPDLWAAEALAALEERAWWARYGL
jgi:signal peptide peptidase SppA